jgi:phosphoinositide-3-kinase regulatory subunit 4
LGSYLISLIGTEYSIFLQDILEKKTQEFFPPTLQLLGERVPSVLAIRKDSLHRVSVSGDNKENSLTPQGILAAHLHEHLSKINVIQVSTDQTFFVSGSDDGTVRIWDTHRLETNVVNRARLVYPGLGISVEYFY